MFMVLWMHSHWNWNLRMIQDVWEGWVLWRWLKRMLHSNRNIIVLEQGCSFTCILDNLRIGNLLVHMTQYIAWLPSWQGSAAPPAIITCTPHVWHKDVFWSIPGHGCDQWMCLVQGEWWAAAAGLLVSQGPIVTPPCARVLWQWLVYAFFDPGSCHKVLC